MKYNDTSYKFYLRKVNKTDSFGYIYLRKIKKRKKSYQSLKLPSLKDEFWNEVTQRVKKRKEIDYKLYNDEIDQTIEDIITNENENNSSSSKKSFLKFFQKEIHSDNLINKHGTRKKFETVYNRLLGYLETQEKTDLSFLELDLEFINEFQNYLKNDGINSNSVNNYLRNIHTLILKSKKTKGYYDVVDPFVNFTFFKKEKKIKEYLTKEEIQIIINSKIKDEKLNKSRSIFLFQFFSKGMRISDILTLRFSNLINGRIHYKMYKTKNEVKFKFTPILLSLISEFIDLKDSINKRTVGERSVLVVDELSKIKKQFDSFNNTKTNHSQRPKSRSPIGETKTTFLNPRYHIPLLYFLKDKTLSYNTMGYFSLYDLILNGLTIDELKKELNQLRKMKLDKGNLRINRTSFIDLTKYYNEINNKIDESILKIEDNLNYIYRKHTEYIIKLLNELGTGKDKDKFVFNMLDNEEFENIGSNNDFSNINLKQYLTINRSSIHYNYSLYELQKYIGFSKKLKPHLPRITYTNLMLNIDGVDVYDISKGLGHSSINVTQSYLNTGFEKDTNDDIHQNFNESFTNKNEHW